MLSYCRNLGKINAIFDNIDKQPSNWWRAVNAYDDSFLYNLTMTHNIPAPLELYTTTVQPEWLDYNNHMTEGFYAVVFAHASDEFIDYVGLDAAYRSRTNCTVYTAESHISYLRELKLGSPLRFTTQLLGYDAKRMHIFHRMFHAEDGFLTAVFETMMLHVDQTKGRVVPMPPEILAKFAAIQASHQRLPRPDKVGKGIAMKKWSKRMA